MSCLISYKNYLDLPGDWRMDDFVNEAGSQELLNNPSRLQKWEGPAEPVTTRNGGGYDWNVLRPVDVIAILDHNITTLVAGDISTRNVGDSLTVQSTISAAWESDEHARHLVLDVDVDAIGVYFDYDLTGQSGNVCASRLWAGPAIRFDACPDEKLSYTIDAIGSQQITVGRNRATSTRRNLKKFSISFTGITEAMMRGTAITDESDNAPSFHDFLMTVGKTREFFIIPDTGTQQAIRRSFVYGFLDSDVKVEHKNGRYNLKLQVQEI